MSRMMNVRVDDALWDAIEECSTSAGVTRSVWLREALGVAVGLTESPHPKQALNLQRANVPRIFVPGCKHPPTAITVLPFTDVCRVCGETVRTR